MAAASAASSCSSFFLPPLPNPKAAINRRSSSSTTLPRASSLLPYYHHYHTSLSNRPHLCPTHGQRKRFPHSHMLTLSFSGLKISSSSSSFLEGEIGTLYKHIPMITWDCSKKISGPRAATDDVPSYKGFPPMLNKPRWWWRTMACIPYLMPLSETWMYAETAYNVHSFLEDYEFCTYPFLTFIGRLPSWFLLAYFFGAYLGIVRNNRWPHFIRFHVVTGMLLEILVQVVGTVNDWVPPSLYWGKFGAYYWLGIAFAFFFTVIECIRCALNGMYADVPFISDASYMQIPFDT